MRRMKRVRRVRRMKRVKRMRRMRRMKRVMRMRRMRGTAGRAPWAGPGSCVPHCAPPGPGALRPVLVPSSRHRAGIDREAGRSEARLRARCDPALSLPAPGESCGTRGHLPGPASLRNRRPLRGAPWPVKKNRK